MWPSPRTYQSDGATFYCWTFNGNPDQELIVIETGYSGSVGLSFSAEVPDTTEARVGLQVSFHDKDEVPDVFNEINYALPGHDTLFGLQEVRTVSLAGDEKTFWRVTPTAVRLINSGNNSTTG